MGSYISHITDARLKVKDLEALDMAGQVLGFELVRDKTSYNWFQNFVGDSAEGLRVAAERGAHTFGKCEHVLRRKGAAATDYEIGVVRDPDGAYSLLYDTWGSGQKLEQAAGVRLARLRQEYSVAVTQRRVEKTLGRQGFRMTRETKEGGRIQLRLRRR
jgi:hypothetical protein